MLHANITVVVNSKIFFGFLVEKPCRTIMESPQKSSLGTKTYSDGKSVKCVRVSVNFKHRLRCVESKKSLAYLTVCSHTTVTCALPGALQRALPQSTEQYPSGSPRGHEVRTTRVR